MREYPDTLRSPGRAAPAEPESDEGRCLGNEEALSFAQGRLNSEQLDKVHAHADRCSACRHLLSEAVHAVGTEERSELDAPAWNTMCQANAVVAQRYRIIRFIARGGMGEVYEAFDCELGERIALKTVASTACDSASAVRRLKAEVQMARRVSHPVVCRIFDLGTHALETGAVIHFLTMEFVDGEPLGERLRSRGKLPMEHAGSLARKLLEGLRAAHRAGILHRDFKSDNVMLRTGPGGELTPVILDFGLARWLQADPRRLTSGRHQGLVGTLSYMAPEQIEGKRLTVSSDLYSFGVVWFEMLTGRLPFEAPTAAANALERLLKPPAPPSSINPEIPEAMDAIVLGCLSRFPEHRYQSADEILAALDLPRESHSRATTSPHALTLSPAGLPERSSRTRSQASSKSAPASARRWASVLAGIGFSAALLLWAWFARGPSAPVTAVSTAEQPVARALESATKAEAEPSAPAPSAPGSPSKPHQPRAAQRARHTVLATLAIPASTAASLAASISAAKTPRPAWQNSEPAKSSSVAAMPSPPPSSRPSRKPLRPGWQSFDGESPDELETR